MQTRLRILANFDHLSRSCIGLNWKPGHKVYKHWYIGFNFFMHFLAQSLWLLVVCDQISELEYLTVCTHNDSWRRVLLCVWGQLNYQCVIICLWTKYQVKKILFHNLHVDSDILRKPSNMCMHIEYLRDSWEMSTPLGLPMYFLVLYM